MNNASVQTRDSQSTGEQHPMMAMATLDQLDEIDAAVKRGSKSFRQRLRFPDAQHLVGAPSLISDAVAIALLALLPKRMPISHTEVERWNKYYRDEHNIAHSFEGLEVPVEVEYPTRLIVMHTEVSVCPQRIATVYKKHCDDKWWQYATDLDVAVSHHDRAGTYAIRVRDTHEAPDGFENGKNFSSQDVWDRGWITTTLPERLIDGDVYLLERKEHLDQKVVTLCVGSRLSGGAVPGVGLRGDGGVFVDYWDPDVARDRLRFRLAIV